MKKERKKLSDRQSGEIMLEASFILVIVIILMLAILSIGFLIYEKVMLVSAANDLAATIAENYKFVGMELGEREIGVDDVAAEKMYRLWFAVPSMESRYKIHADEYAENTVSKLSLGVGGGEPTIDECDIQVDGFGRAHVIVKISAEREIFLGGVLESLGIADRETLFSAQATADCVDITGYAGVVKFASFVCDNPIMKPLNSIASAINNLKDTISILANF